MFLVSEKMKATFPYERNMQSSVEDKEENSQGKLLQQIVTGYYPSKDVSRMNVKSLERFVLRLLEYTSVRVGAKPKSDPRLTNWCLWPSDLSVHKSTSKTVKEFRGNLKKVVIDCCDFFKDYNQKWLPPTQSWINDENVEFIKVKSEKRRINEPIEIPNTKKRKTLLLSVKKESSWEPFKSESRYLPESDEPTKPINQSEFLQLFQLSLNNNDIPKPTQVPNSSRIIRLQNCPHVPFSSDVGQVLLKRENFIVPDLVIHRKIDRVEWYINKESSKFIPNLKFEVTYEPNKSKKFAEHQFRFPKRQYHQTLGDRHFNSFVHKICKPLTVQLKNENLVELKKKLDKLKVKVRVNRLSSKQLKTHVCKEAKVVLERKRVVREHQVISLNNDISKTTKIKIILKDKLVPSNMKIVLDKSKLRNTRSASKRR